MAGVLTQDELKSLLRYDPESGVFTRLVRTSPRALIGAVAGCIDSKGYVAIRVKSKRHRAHRLAWLYMTGRFSTVEIDHCNGVRNDNRWINLREATSAQNRQNAVAHRDNQSRLLGVSRPHGRGKWSARIQAGGRTRYLGVFDDPVAAHAAYLKAKAQLHAFNPTARA